jgi:hypothetical protein
MRFCRTWTWPCDPHICTRCYVGLLDRSYPCYQKWVWRETLSRWKKWFEQVCQPEQTNVSLSSEGIKSRVAHYFFFQRPITRSEKRHSWGLLFWISVSSTIFRSVFYGMSYGDLSHSVISQVVAVEIFFQTQIVFYGIRVTLFLWEWCTSLHPVLEACSHSTTLLVGLSRGNIPSPFITTERTYASKTVWY